MSEAISGTGFRTYRTRISLRSCGLLAYCIKKPGIRIFALSQPHFPERNGWITVTTPKPDPIADAHRAQIPKFR